MLAVRVSAEEIVPWLAGANVCWKDHTMQQISGKGLMGEWGQRVKSTSERGQERERRRGTDSES